MQAQAVDLNGLEAAVAAARGAPLVLHHFATWCEPCEEELPELARLLGAHAPPGTLKVAISWDLFLMPVAPEAAIEACRAFLARLGGGFDRLFVYTGAPPELFASFDMGRGTVPFTELRDAAGARVAVFAEPILDAAAQQRFAAALAALGVAAPERRS
jgi:thiol-disulfide isomerase/thioredoxin